MSSNIINLTDSNEDDEDVEKTPHHNITVVLKEIACSPIPRNICSHGIEQFNKLVRNESYNRENYMKIVTEIAAHHRYTVEELEDIVENLEASRGYSKKGIEEKLEEIEKHHGYNNQQMTKMLEKLNETDQYAILHYATNFNNIPFWRIMIEDYNCNVNLVGWDGETPLHIAARLIDIDQPNQTKDSSILLYLLSLPGVSKNIRDSEGRTPLHLAVMYNCSENVNYLLLDDGVELDIGDVQGATPLHYACRFHPNINLIKLFLNKDSTLFNCKTIDKKRPIDTAAEYGNLDILKHLFDNNDFRKIEEKDSAIALINAAVRHHENKVLSFLKEQHQHIAHHHFHTLHFACRQLHGYKMVSHLIDDNSIKYQDKQAGLSPLMVAVQHRQIECVKELLTHKACTSQIIHLISPVTLRNVFHICAEVNQKEITEQLCQPRYLSKLVVLAVDIQGDTPLHICAKVDNGHMTKLLLDYIKKNSSTTKVIPHSTTIEYRSMTNLDANGRAPLKVSPQKKQTNDEPMSAMTLIKKMLMKKNKNKYTPLHVAIYYASLKVIEEILESSDGTMINADDDQKRTSLHMAAEKGHVDIIKILLEHGADANACDINDWTPLHDAAKCSIHRDDNKERADCIEILVKLGKAHINALNIRRETPLHIACEYGSKKLIKCLLKLGADLFATNVHGYNCLEVAIEEGNEQVVKYLIEDDNGFDLMRNAQLRQKEISWRSLFGKRYKVDTPMRKLIREMPKMALFMLNKCSMIVGTSGTAVHKNIFVYEFLEDQYTVKDWTEGNFGVHKEPDDHQSTLYTSNKVDLVRNHPLFMMESCEIPELMSHPVSACLIKQKFYNFGIFIFALFILFYVIYLSLFTTIVLRGQDPQIYYNLTNFANFDNSLCPNVSQVLNQGLSDAGGIKTTADYVLRDILYAIIWLHIIKNLGIIISIIQISFVKTWTYWIEISAVALCFAFVYDQDYQKNLTFRCPLQWQYGAFALLLSWLCLLHYVQLMPIIGIYVSMLLVISKKFMKFLIVLIILISAFALTFYMIFHNFDVFSNAGLSYIKTALMITGDMTYEDQMFNSNTPAYYKLGYLIYVMFAVLMAIFVTNLLIGLAVGDIPPLMKQAADERNRLFFELVANFEIFRYQISSLICCFKTNDTMNYTFQDLNEKSRFQQLKDSIIKFISGSTDTNDQSDANSEQQIEQQTMILRSLKKQMEILVDKTKTSANNYDADSD